MRAVMIGLIDDIVEDRRRKGIDSQDECWDGEWHFVNPPKLWHPQLNGELFLVLGPLAKARGLIPLPDAAGVFAAEKNWRVPDQVYARPEHGVEEGVTSAELVVELRSPGDDTYKKLPFYAAREIGEVLVVHEDRRFELYRLRTDGTYALVENPDGSAHCMALAVTFRTIEGPRLGITWDGGEAEV